MIQPSRDCRCLCHTLEGTRCDVAACCKHSGRLWEDVDRDPELRIDDAELADGQGVATGVIDADQAKSLIARIRVDEELTDAELDALAGFFAEQAPATTADIKGDSERGRHIRLALMWHKLLNEVLG